MIMNQNFKLRKLILGPAPLPLQNLMFSPFFKKTKDSCHVKDLKAKAKPPLSHNQTFLSNPSPLINLSLEIQKNQLR